MLKQTAKMHPQATLKLRSSYTLKLRSRYAQGTLKVSSSTRSCSCTTYADEPVRAQAMLKPSFQPQAKLKHVPSCELKQRSSNAQATLKLRSSYAQATQHHRIQPTLKDMRVLKISQAHC